MRKSISYSAMTLALMLAAGPVSALELGGSLGGEVSANGSDSRSVGASADGGGALSGSLGSAGASATGTAAGASPAGTASLDAIGNAALTTASGVSASANGASGGVSLAGGLAGAPVVSADGARVGTVVGIGVGADLQAATLHTRIGGFLGLGATPVQFAIDTTTVTETQIQLPVTEAELDAFIEAQTAQTASVAGDLGAAAEGNGSAQLAANANSVASAAPAR